VIDADQLGRYVLDKDGEAYGPVVAEFGEDILDAEGDIDRAALGSSVFDDPQRRAKLEAITHPAIARLAHRGLEMIAERGETMAFYEAALLVETGVHERLEALVVVSCSVATQLARVIARNGLSKEAAAARIASQFPLEEKLKVADYVIENNGELEETRARAAEVLAELSARFGAGSGGR